jgi:hypothetical protein
MRGNLSCSNSSNVVEKCLKSAHLIFINNVISGYFNSDVCNFD